MSGQHEPTVQLAARPVTTTDMLLAQMIGLLGEIRLSLSQEAHHPARRVVTEPKKPTHDPVATEPKKRTRKRASS